jgi:uncharacterized protein YigE (DUF2233 family)
VILLPVKSNRDDVKVTVYQQQDSLLIVYASWAKEHVQIQLTPDWNALKMKPAQVSIVAPAVAGLQEKQEYTNLEKIDVSPGKGGFIIISKKSHTL